MKSKFQVFKNYLLKCKDELKNIKHPTKKELYPRIIGVIVICGVVSLSFVVFDLIIKWFLFLFF